MTGHPWIYTIKGQAKAMPEPANMWWLHAALAGAVHVATCLEYCAAVTYDDRMPSVMKAGITASTGLENEMHERMDYRTVL